MDPWKWNGAVATTAGIVLGVTATAFVAATLRGPSAGDWLQFSATLLGAGATIFAGWLALKAVYTQIDHRKAERSSELKRAIEIALMYAKSLRVGADEAADYFNYMSEGESIVNPDSITVSGTIDRVDRNMIYVTELERVIDNFNTEDVACIRTITSAVNDLKAFKNSPLEIDVELIDGSIEDIKAAAERAIQHFGSHSAASDARLSR